MEKCAGEKTSGKGKDEQSDSGHGGGDSELSLGGIQSISSKEDQLQEELATGTQPEEEPASLLRLWGG